MNQAPLSCKVQSQSQLVELRECRAEIQGGRSVELSSLVPNPASNPCWLILLVYMN